MLNLPKNNTHTDSTHTFPKRKSAPTFRSLLLGTAGVAILCALTPYNDFHLKQTYLYGNHFPLGCLFLFTLLTLIGNPLIRRISPHHAFSRIELLTIWVMLISGSGLASSGLMRYLGPLTVAPFYYATESNNWLNWTHHIPTWMVPSHDPHSPAVQWFFEGAPRGENIPWQPWVHVFAAWGLLFACVVGLSVCVCSLVKKQWIEQEKLSFPLIQIPLEMSREPQSGLLNQFFRSPLLWMGVGAAVFVRAMSGLHAYYSWVPAISLRWDLTTNPEFMPWSAIGFGHVELFLSVIGVMFILPTEVSFSLWAFFIGFRLVRLVRAMMGMQALAGTVPNHEVAMSIGGFLLWGIWMLWSSRKQVLNAWRQDNSSTADKGHKSTQLASIGALAFFTGAMSWTIAAGLDPWLAVSFWGLFVLIMVVITRVVAESGLLFVQSSFSPTDLLSVIPGSRFLSAHSLGSAMMVQTVLVHDTREALMPTVMNSLKIRQQHTGGGMLRAMLLAIAVGYVVSFVSFLHTSYTYGGLNLDAWGNVYAPAIFYNQIGGFIAAPKGADPAAVGNILLGGAITAGLLFMRSNFLWWSLHPIGFILGGTYAVSAIWFSIFVAWLLKSIIVKWGGLRLFKAALPFFFGLVIGEALAGGVWIIIGMLTGVSVPLFMPG